MSLLQLRCGDALTELQKLESNTIDCMVTDPPYGYAFMNKDWDRVVVSVDIWKECLRVMKAGAFAFIMCAPRQDVLSRQIVNLQDAGFETGFTSIYWTYASGFPKAADVSKLVDKRNGTLPEQSREFAEYIKSKPATDAAKELDGAYAGFQPKPAVEVVLTVMKPLSEKSYVDQALANGHGVTWLDSCRIPYQSEQDIEQLKKDTARLKGISMLPPERGWNQNNMVREEYKLDRSGRFPANLLVSDDVLNDGKIYEGRLSDPSKNVAKSIFGTKTPYHTSEHGQKDLGSFSRYFGLDKWFQTTFPFAIITKPSKREKNMGLDKWIPKKVNDGRKTEIDNPFQRGETPRLNVHPTVKPLKLMCYLIALASRPNDIILDPFCGSGTTLIAAQMLQRQAVGIELNADYLEIAKVRLGHAAKQERIVIAQ